MDSGEEFEMLEFVINNQTEEQVKIESISEWKCIEIDISHSPNPYVLADVVKALPGAISINVYIARNSEFYKNAFIIPLVGKWLRS